MNFMTRSEFVVACPSVLALFGGDPQAISVAMVRVGGAPGRTVGSGGFVDYSAPRARLMVARQIVLEPLRELTGLAGGLTNAGRWLGTQVATSMPLNLVLDGDGFVFSVAVPEVVAAELNALVPSC